MPVITGDWHEYEGKQRRKGKHAGGLDHDIAPPACVSSPFSNKQDSAQTQLPVNKQDEPLTLEVVIAEPYVGMVLGPGGNTLKRIGKRFNMSILPSANRVGSNPRDKTLKLVGTRQTASYAEDLIRLLIGVQNPDLYPAYTTQHVERFYVPQKQVGRVVGQQGKTRLVLQETHDIFLCVPHMEASRNEPQVLLTVIGDSVQAAACKAEIEDILSRCNPPSRNLDKRARSRSRTRSPGPVQARKVSRSRSPKPKQEPRIPRENHIFVNVVNQRIGIVIGRGGETRKRLESKYRVTVFIPEATDTDPQAKRSIKIVGKNMDDVYDCRDDILDLADRVPENLRREDRNVSKPLKRPRNDSRSPSRDRSMDRSDPRMSKPSGRNNSPNTFRSGPRSRSPSRDSNNRRRSVSSRDSDDRRRSSGSFKGGRSPSVTRGQLSSRPARSRSPMKSTDMLRNSFSRSPVGSRDDQPKFGDSFKKLTQDIAASTTGRPSSNWSGDQNDRKKLSPNKRDSFSRSRDDDRSDRDRNQSRPRDIRIERAGNYSDGPSKYRNDTWTKDRSRSRDRSENTHMERNAGFKVPNTRRRPSRSPDDERFSNTSGVTNAVSHQQHTAGSARGSESSSGLESGQIRSQSESGQLRSQTETMSGSEQQRVEVPTAGTARKSRSTLVASQRADKYTPLTRPVWHCYTLRKRG